ncbi:hypothetical protein LJR225_004067 [Phenylobacterium sp. LjRoot225]|uniref:hypothetical protein n=1 Tax=Phenylobacterium sp. LjRoot225 TaxID=3342285 RepID=UPI003ECFF6EA
MAIIDNIRFRDIDQREKREIQRIESRLGVLRTTAPKRPLNHEEIDEERRLKEIAAELKADPTEVCDPLYVGVRDLFNASDGILGRPLGNHVAGKLPIDDDDAIIKAALTLGFLIADNVAAPPVMVLGAAAPAAAAGGVVAPTIVTMSDQAAFRSLSRAFFGAIGEAQAVHELAKLVLPILAIEGDPDGRGGDQPSVDAGEFARVVRALVERNVTADEAQLRRRVNEALDRIQRVGANKPITEMSLALPEFDVEPANEVVKQHVEVFELAVPAAMLDELGVFDVVDKMAEMAVCGALSIPPGEAGKMFYRYWKDAPFRMSAADRRAFLALTIGTPGGPPNNDMVNKYFRDLWLRFVVAVPAFMRRNDVDNLLRPAAPSVISHQQVRKAARDLIVNMSRYAYGMTYYTALDVQEQIKFMIDLLNDKDVKASCNANNMWDVIDYYSSVYLERPKSAPRYRTLANSSAIIAAWLSSNVDRIMEPTGPLIDVDAVRFPPPRPSGQTAKTDPTDFDLVEACELWQLDTATSAEMAEAALLPREAPPVASRPIPSFAREMLDSVDVGLGFARH